ncbi:MAG: aspartate/glutamate racemase family protein [Chloroflexota bacterium]
MKTIGLIGGMSWESSVEYYRIINQLVREKMGGLHSAKSVMVSVDFGPVEALMQSGGWDGVLAELIQAARQVQAGGADFLLIATNTMHKMYAEVADAIEIPMIHIADAAGVKIKEAGLSRVGLLGTAFTMAEDFYTGRLAEQFGLDVLVPDEAGQAEVNRIIFEELVVGKILPESKTKYLEVIGGLVARGAQGVILGCTEIPLLVKAEDASVPLFDTTFIHAEAAVEEAGR